MAPDSKIVALSLLGSQIPASKPEDQSTHWI